MRYYLSEQVKNSKRYKTKNKQRLLRQRAASTFKDVSSLKNGSYFHKNDKKTRCYYRDNFYFETEYSEEKEGWVIVRAREKNISKDIGGTFPSIRRVFCNTSKQMVEKKIILHPDHNKICHVTRQRVSRNIKHHEILRALTEGIRVESHRDGSYLYFANDVKVVASETEDEIRITTVMRINTFSEKNLIELIPKITDALNELCVGNVTFEIKDKSAENSWKSSPEFIRMKELDAILSNSLIPEDVKDRIINSPGKSGFYTVYQEAQFDLLTSSVNSRNIGYRYPTKEGCLSIEKDFCFSNLDTSAKIDMNVYLDSDSEDDWEIIISNLKRLGAHNLSPIYRNSNNECFVSIRGADFNGNFDERFGCKDDFSYLKN